MNLFLVIEYVFIGALLLLLLLFVGAISVAALSPLIEHAYEYYQREGGRRLVLKALKTSAMVIALVLTAFLFGWASFEFTSATPKAGYQALIDLLVVEES